MFYVSLSSIYIKEKITSHPFVGLGYYFLTCIVKYLCMYLSTNYSDTMNRNLDGISMRDLLLLVLGDLLVLQDQFFQKQILRQ